MTSPKYKEKELTIMRALLSLISNGASISEIKASDIAREAGLGKGTLYNYFASKEDIFAKTIIYSIHTQLFAIFEQMRRFDTFRDKCYTVLRVVNEIIMNKNSDFHLVLFNVGGKDMKQFFDGDLSFVQEYLSMIHKRVLLLARLGASEGVILPVADEEYTYSVFAGALMSFIHARCRCETADEQTICAAMDNAYQMLLKALN